MAGDRLIPLAEAARRAGITRSALLHAHRKGRLELTWFGPVRAVDEAELERYMRERRQWRTGRRPSGRQPGREGRE